MSNTVVSPRREGSSGTIAVTGRAGLCRRRRAASQANLESMGFGHRLCRRSTSDSPTAKQPASGPPIQRPKCSAWDAPLSVVRAFVWPSSNAVPTLDTSRDPLPRHDAFHVNLRHCKTPKLTLRDREDPRTLQWRSWGARRTGLQRSAPDGTNRTPPEATLAQLWSGLRAILACSRPSD